MNETYRAHFSQKGYTRNDEICRPKPITEVPLELRDRYKTVEEYKQALHDFLNSN